MAYPTACNDQVTDSVTQANLKTLGDAPSMALSNLSQATSQAIANAAHNQTFLQQQSSMLAQVAATACAKVLQTIPQAPKTMVSKGRAPE